MTVKTSVGSLRSKRFQSSYWANVRTEEEMIAPKPTILENAL